jgi:hypothetical protein
MNTSVRSLFAEQLLLVAAMNLQEDQINDSLVPSVINFQSNATPTLREHYASTTHACTHIAPVISPDERYVTLLPIHRWLFGTGSHHAVSWVRGTGGSGVEFADRLRWLCACCKAHSGDIWGLVGRPQDTHMLYMHAMHQLNGGF